MPRQLPPVARPRRGALPAADKGERHVIGRFTAMPCQCPSACCPDWHVSPVANVHGVRLTREQAIAVATMLDQMPNSEED